jgi:hypothetical protein
MNKRRSGIVAIGLALVLIVPLLRGQEERPAGLRIRPGLDVEFMSRTISWDDDTRTSKLKGPLGYFSLEFEPLSGLGVALIGGYAFSDPSGLVFRQLPFSIDYEAGSIGGVYIGAEVRKTLLTAGFWEIGLEGRYGFFLGSTAIFDFEEVAEDGQIDVKGHWMRVQIGPAVIYRGFELFSPFLTVAFDKLWGQFTMTQEIEDLTGSEEKAVRGKGAVSVTLGTIFEPSPHFTLRLAGTIVPCSKGEGQGLTLDIGGSLRAVLSF